LPPTLQTQFDYRMSGRRREVQLTYQRATAGIMAHAEFCLSNLI
jgi:hypothetical protein